VLRHALADPLSAATVKAEVLAARLHRERPDLEVRVQDLSRDLARTGGLLELLGALAAGGEERAERTPLARLLAPLGAAAAGVDPALALLVRPAAAADAVRRLVAFGAARGGAPSVSVRAGSGRAEILVEGLGDAAALPVARLLLLPRDVPGAEDLFLARAAADADGGTLELSVREGRLAAALSWPLAPEAA
jgi:hypothetical protein